MIEQGDEMAAGSKGGSSHPGHFCAREILPGMLAQVLYYVECFLSVFTVLLELL